MNWQVFIVINLLSQSLLVPLQRVLLRKKSSDPIAFIVVSQLLTGLILLPFVLVHGLVIPNLHTYGLLILAMFMLYTFGNILYAKTLKQVEASVFQTLLNTNTIWVVLLGYIVLKEHVSLLAAAGTLLVLASVGLLIERKRPFKLEKSIALGLLMGLVLGVALSLWIYIGKHSDLLSWTFLSFMGTPLIIALVRPKTYTSMGYYLQNKVLIRLMILAGVWAIDNLAALGAYKAGTVSLVAPILQSSVILSVIISVIFLHERHHLTRKIVASIICFLGVILLVS